jgi:uroporphyrinogen-III synthase
VSAGAVSAGVGGAPRRVLVTRPKEEAAALALRLEAIGFAAVVEPLLEIVGLPGAALDLDFVQAILVTSPNGARALALRLRRRDPPVFAVGEASAAVLEEAGFARVDSAAGDAPRLVALVRDRLDPAAGTLLHARGAAVAQDPLPPLAAAGFKVRSAVLYEVRTPFAFSRRLIRTMRHRDLGYALFFSPRTGRTFVSLAHAAGLVPACDTIEALCLSPAVAAAVGGVRWRSLKTAVRPDTSAILALLPPVGSTELDQRDHVR